MSSSRFRGGLKKTIYDVITWGKNEQLFYEKFLFKEMKKNIYNVVTRGDPWVPSLTT